MHFKILFNLQKSKSMKKNNFLIIILMFFLICPLTSSAETALKKGEKIISNSDYLFYDLKNKIIKASGNVVAHSDGKLIKGDNIEVDRKNNTIAISGNAFLETEEGNISGESIVLNNETKKGVIKNGKIFVSEVHFYIKGDRIEKTGEKTYIAENASVTSCDKPENDWEIKASKLKATIDGYGHVFNATLNTRENPLFYIPWMFFPLKTERESGFLVPEFEYSEQDGAQYNQPYYLVLSDQADATFYYHFIEKRSDRKGFEFRLRNSDSSYTELYYDEIQNDPYLYNEDSYEDPDIKNHDRYWFRLKSDLNFDSGFKVNIDIDHASDPDYISEFDSNYLGYEHVDKSFSENFGRNLEEDDDYERTNRILVSKTFQYASFETELFWNDDLVLKETGAEDDTVQTLPRVSLYVPRKSIFNLPLQTSFDTEYDYFHRIYGEKGHRVNVTPTLYLPINFSNFLSLEPSAYVNETFWYTEEKDRESGSDEYNFRQIYGFDLKASTSVYKVFDTKGETIEKIKHTITPELTYSFIPDQDQESLPDFDDFDRLERKKELEFSLIQTLTTKEILPSINENDPKKYSYKEIVRFELSQIYDISENEKAEESEVPYEAKPFEDLEAYLKITPCDRFNLEYDAKWSHYDYLLSERNIAINAFSENGSRIGFEHRYTHDENESLIVTADLIFSPEIRIHGRYETTLMEDNLKKDDYEKEIGLEYTSQCWSSDLSYSEEEDDRKVTLRIFLKGFGGMYQSVSE